MKFRNLVIIGTSHIARQSLKEVGEAIENEKPGLIALELDRRRLASLMQEERKRPGLQMIRQLGLTGYLFAIIGGWAQEKLGRYVGVAPGSEMKKAIIMASQRKIDLALIDRDIAVTMKRLSKAFTWREKWRLVLDLLKLAFFRNAQKRLALSWTLQRFLTRRLYGI